MVENSNRGSSFQKIKPIKPNVSPYSWRRKKNSNATVEMELATYKIINIMNKSKMKRTSSVILTFIDMITKTEFDHMLFVCQRQLSKIFGCEEAYIFVKDLKSQLRVITRDQAIKHYPVEELHKIGQVFKSRESMKIGKSRAYLDYDFYHDLILNKITNGIIVPIIDKSTKTSIGVFMIVNKINSKSFNNDEYGLCEMIARFLSGILKIHCAKEQLSEIEQQSFALTKCCYRLFIFNDIESLILEAQDICCQILKIECCRVYLLDPKTKDSFTIYQQVNNSKSFCNGIQQNMKVSTTSGIVGATYNLLRNFGPLLTNKSEYYDSFVDLNTKMPLVSIPIKFGISNKVLGVFQFSWPKMMFAFEENSSILEVESRLEDQQEYRYIEIFIKYLACAIINIQFQS